MNKINDTSCFENWIVLKWMWGLNLTNYNSPPKKNVLMTILGKTRALKFFLLMKYKRSRENIKQEMVRNINNTSCFEDWIALKQMWGLTLTDYNSPLIKNVLMTILGKIRSSKSFWFMRYEIRSEQMEQDMVSKMNDTPCFEN